jgi:peroxiredoxin family protein
LKVGEVYLHCAFWGLVRLEKQQSRKKQRSRTVEKQKKQRSREKKKNRKAKSREAEKQRSRETEIKKNAQNEQIIQNKKALLKQTPPHCLTASTSAEP